MKRLPIIVMAVTTFFIVACSGHKNAPLYEMPELIPVSIDGDKWGYVDVNGTYVINPQFDDACCFSDGLAPVYLGDKWGFINKKGEYIIFPQYIDVTGFSDGKAFVVKEKSRPECINTHGDVLFTVDQEMVDAFSEGLARVKTQDGDYGFLDQSGKMVIMLPQAMYAFAVAFQEGLSLVRNNEDKWGFINKKGNLVIPFMYAEAAPFNEGLAPVKFGEGGESSWGFIDKTGKIVINPQFDRVSSFHNGLAYFRQGNLYGFIDKKGKIVINPQYDGVNSFGSSGYAPVEIGGKYGYIDKKGKIVINPQFDYVSHFYGKYAFVKKDGRVGIINTKGLYITNPQFRLVNYPGDEPFHVENYYFDANAAANVLCGTGESAIIAKLMQVCSKGTNLRAIVESPVFDTIRHNGASVYYKGSKFRRLFNATMNIDGIQFKFDGRTSSSEYNYHDNEWTTVYHYDVGLELAFCSISMDGKGRENAAEVAKAVSEKIEKMTNCKMTYHDKDNDMEANYRAWDNNSGRGFVVLFDEHELIFAVCIDKGTYDEIDN